MEYRHLFVQVSDCVLLLYDHFIIILSIIFPSMMRLNDAEQWCSLAMKFLPHLSKSLCGTYQEQVSHR